MDEFDMTGQPPAPPAGPPPNPVNYHYDYGGAPPQHQQKPPRRSSGGGGAGWSVLKMLGAGVIGALIVLLLMPALFGVNPYDLVRGKVKVATTTVPATSNSSSKTSAASTTTGTSDVTTVAKTVAPSVVNIDVQSAPQNNYFFSTQAVQGTGSGVIYTADGYIITNNHVVADAQTITVTLASGEELKAKKVGTDPENDIAVVKIDKTGLPAISTGNSDKLQVGQLVVAVGSPLGFEQTVTAGIVSALHRNVSADESNGQSSTLTNLIQTDAPINPGNSGGALCDGSSSLVGINALIASQSGGSVGIGFAIPINTAKQVADALIAGKPVSHPYIGVQGQTVSADIASQYNLPVTEGTYITAVVPNSPAAKAGLQVGDIVVSANGQPVKSMDDLIAAVRAAGVGGKVSLTYYRGTTKNTVNVTVQEEPANLGTS